MSHTEQIFLDRVREHAGESPRSYVQEVVQSRRQSVPGMALIITDADLRVVHADGAAIPRHGYRVHEWPGRLLEEVLPADLLAVIGPRYRAAAVGEHQSFDYWSHDRSRAYWAQLTPVRGESGAITLIIAIMQDITERVTLIDELALSEARLQESERMAGVGSWEIITETGAISYSRGYAGLLGLLPGAPLDTARLATIVHQDDRGALSRAIAECQTTGSASWQFRVTRRDGVVRTMLAEGELVDARPGRPEHVRATILDVTDQRAERDRLDAASQLRHGFDASPVGMVLTDAADWLYVRVNDAMCRLLDRSREDLIGVSSDTVTHPEDRAADRDARRMMLEGGLPSVQSDKRYVRPDGSVVWATQSVSPVYGIDGAVEAFFTHVVDISHHKEREVLFEQDVNDALWLGRIREAIDGDRLVLYRQPIVDLLTGETVQQELLIRMVAEDGSIIGPGDFLPVAERYGLIAEIDRWVIRQAAQLAANGEPTEFNLSAASIGDPHILRELASAIEETGADPSLLVVEVTETAMMKRIDAGRAFAEQVTALGCQLALDDFGTGFACLNYLKQVPAQHLKIDIEFVRDLTRSETDERLVRGIIGMAREFNQTTIAEGIEDEATLVRLRELGVHLGQGYLFGRPQPLSAASHAGGGGKATAEPKPPGHLVDIVHRAFEAFATRNLADILKHCHHDIVMRPHRSTADLTGRDAYRGYVGVRAYLEDVARVWHGLTLTPLTFRPAADSVIVFGRAEPHPATEPRAVDVLWVFGVRDGLVASVEVFGQPGSRH